MGKSGGANRTRFAVVFGVLVLAFVVTMSCTSKEVREWEAAQAENSVSGYEGFLAAFPESEYRPEAENLILDLLPLIAFTSQRDGSFTAYTMRYDGSQETRISEENLKATDAVMSPDGTRIAYVTDRDGDAEIWVVNSDGTDAVRLTDNQFNELSPAWSPDGQKIAMMSDRDGNPEIYVMNADGKDPVRLTDHPGADLFPTWSPDGSRIAFTVHREGEKRVQVMSTAVEDFATTGGYFDLKSLEGDIWVINADGSGAEVLVSDPSNNARPTWSPDGHQIVFNSNRDGDQEIYAINIDGTGLTRLTNRKGVDRSPFCYQKNGEILFTCDEGGTINVWMMEADGSEPRQMTEAPEDDMMG